MPTLMTDGEQLLYKILQRANLGQYFELFISQGGDDVRQLCEASEEEFLEIMALVGMASKPLHVRRLQKTLHEWITNPGLYQSNEYMRTVISAPKGSIMATVPQKIVGQFGSADVHGMSRNDADVRSGWEDSYDGSNDRHPRRSSPYPETVETDQLFSDWQQSCHSPVTQSEANIQLNEEQISALEAVATEMAKTMPLYAPRPLNMKKPVDKEIDEVMNLSEDSLNRMELIRKYSAIYGRFDSKKSAEKVLYMHQVLVNEAAAQLCKHRPTLLTRRDDLFPLARQVVRDSGLQCSRPQVRSREGNTADDMTPVKLSRLEFSNSDRLSYGENFDSCELEDSQRESSVRSQSPDTQLNNISNNDEEQRIN